MATKRESIPSLVSKTIEGKNITPNTPVVTTPKEKQRFAPPPKRQVQIRFDPGDYEQLQIIAHRKGTTAAALIRETVKQIIKNNIVT